MRLLLPLAAALALPFALAAAQPGIPATFFGSVSLNGEPVPDGTPIAALIDGVDCTSPATQGSTLRDGVSTYVVLVLSEAERPGCGAPGLTVQFTVAGQLAPQSAIWTPEPQRLDLNVGSGSPVPLPTSTTTPTIDPAATPTPPTAASPTPEGVSSSATIAADSSGGDGGGGGRTLGFVLLLSGLAIAAGAGAMALSRRKPR